MDRALKAAAAKNEYERAAALERKLTKFRILDSRREEMQNERANAYAAEEFSRCQSLDAALKSSPVVTLFVAIALDAFPVNTIVRTSVAGDGVVAGTAGEVIGHSPKGNILVRFKAGEAVFEIAKLKSAELPNGWTVKQMCFSVVELPGEVSVGQSGAVMGWSTPFDCDKIMADFGGHQVNVQLNQIETVEQFKKVRLNADLVLFLVLSLAGHQLRLVQISYIYQLLIYLCDPLKLLESPGAIVSGCPRDAANEDSRCSSRQR